MPTKEVILRGQVRRVFDVMADGRWHSHGEIANITKDPQACVAASIRHLRNKKYGGFVVKKKQQPDRSKGLYLYKVVVPAEVKVVP